MSWDESEALLAIQDALEIGVDSGFRVHIVRSLDPLTWGNIETPCFCFKDGEQTVGENDRCHIDYEFSGVVASSVKDECGGAVVGRVPIATFPGVVYYSKMIANLLDYENIISIISLTNSNLQASKVISVSPSETVFIEDSGDWQIKELSAIMRFRITE